MKKTLQSTAIATFFATVGGQSFAEQITITGASCFPIGSPPSASFEAVVNDINERGKGVIQIDLKGGAPAIGSPFTLTQKMSRGVYDIVGCVEAYFENIFPEAPVLRFAEVPFAALRENGGIDKVNELLANANIHYVGRHFDSGPYHLWLSEPIDEPDLTGLNLRVAPIYTAFFKEMGATVQTADIGQIYTLLENNTIQGYGWPVLGWVPSWVKVTNYRVEPGFYNGSLHTVANLDAWNALSPEAQAIITAVVIEHEIASEPTNPDHMAVIQAQKDKTAAEGLESIEFSAEQTEHWIATAKEAGWNEVLERSPEHAAELRELFTQ